MPTEDELRKAARKAHDTLAMDENTRAVLKAMSKCDEELAPMQQVMPIHIDTDINFVHAMTIGDAWREVMWLCVKNGWDFLVKGGSYEGQIRKQLPYVTILIDRPGMRPLAPILPPAHAKSAPTNDDKIVAYFHRYIVGTTKAPGEDYTYGEFIMEQFERVLHLLTQAQGNTNQATICIGNELTTFLKDPPCLRHISFKVVGRKLNMCVYFRSWDLYAGLPENLGGLQLLKEEVLRYLNMQPSMEDIEDGQIIAFSDGLHIYDQYFELVDALNINKIKVGQIALAEKQAFIEREGV